MELTGRSRSGEAGGRTEPAGRSRAGGAGRAGRVPAVSFPCALRPRALVVVLGWLHVTSRVLQLKGQRRPAHSE